METVDFFRALGDPIRLEMVVRLSERAPQTISSVSRDLNISRQGARKHLQVLADTQIVTLESKGRDTLVNLNKKTIEQGKAFILELEKRWDKRLEMLKKFVEENDVAEQGFEPQ